MEKITFSRTDISEDVLLQLAKTSELIKRLNSLTLVNHIQKKKLSRNCSDLLVVILSLVIISIATLVRISMLATISMLI